MRDLEAASVAMIGESTAADIEIIPADEDEKLFLDVGDCNSLDKGDMALDDRLDLPYEKRDRRNRLKGCCTDLLSAASQLGSSPIGRYGRECGTKKNAMKKLPIINWLPKYRMKHAVGDLIAGLTVGMTVIPQGLAYAVVAELPPQYGLYSAFIGAIFYTFLGTSKDITLGPTAIMSLLIAEFASERSPIHSDPTYAIILTLVSGIIQLAMGLLNMGFIVQFVSHPVISGFTSAAAIIIGCGQLKKILGLQNIPRAFLPQLKAIFQNISQTNYWDVGLGLTCIVILTLLKYVKEFTDRRMKSSTGCRKAFLKFLWLICTARNAVVVVACAGFAAIVRDVYGIQGDKTLSLTDRIESGFPVPAVPKMSLEVFDEHTNTTITRTTGEIFSDIGEGFIVIALLGMMESIAIAKAFAHRNDYRIDPSQELVAVGVCNALSSFFHSFPVTGSFSRTAINSQSGVRTPAGGIWTGLIVIISIVALTPYFTYIPEASLAAIIICAVIQMVEYDVVLTLWKCKKSDLLPLLTTFCVCIFGNIEYGIMAGVGLSVLMLLFPMARPGLKVSKRLIPNTISETRQEAVILEPRSGIVFPAVEYIKEKAMKHGVYETPNKDVILLASHISRCDYTTVLGVSQICDTFYKHNLRFVIADCAPDVQEVLKRGEIGNLIFSDSVDSALAYLATEDDVRESAP